MPVLVIQGTEDEVINVSHGVALHEAAPTYVMCSLFRSNKFVCIGQWEKKLLIISIHSWRLFPIKIQATDTIMDRRSRT